MSILPPFKKNCFIYLFLAALGLCWALGLSLFAVSGGYSSLWFMGFSLRWLLLLWSTGSRSAGSSNCGAQPQQLWLVGSRVQAQQLWRMGLVALQHVGSSRTRAQTCVPCIGRRILNHSRETPLQFLKIENKRNTMFKKKKKEKFRVRLKQRLSRYH